MVRIFLMAENETETEHNKIMSRKSLDKIQFRWHFHIKSNIFSLVDLPCDLDIMQNG